MDIDAFLTELNIRTGDTDNFAFTIEEKQSILKESIKDDWVVKTIRNTTLVYTTGTFSYNKPAGMDTIKDIYVALSSTDAATKISLPWEVIEGIIYFRGGSDIIPSGTTLELRGNYKYLIGDTIQETDVQEYVLKLAHWKLLSTLGTKRAFKFLKNDTTMSEIINLKRDLERDVTQYRKSLPREFEVA